MEVGVVGAGPAGSVAAISALRAGHSIRILEEHARAGEPQHCSGLVSREGLETLADIVDYRPFVINSIKCAVFDFAGEPFIIDRKRETAFVIDRAALDRALAQKAEEEGARISYGKRFSPVEFSASEAQAVIGADGALSAIAHHYSFPPIKNFAFTLKCSAKIKVPDAHRVTLFYDNRFFPGFFGWLIPHGENEAEIGMGTTNQKFLKPGFEFLMKKTAPQSVSRPAGKIIPLNPRKRIAGVFGPRDTHVLLAGDAAGQVKSSSGGGLVFGTAGARLAGALVHAPFEYEAEFRKRNFGDMQAHDFLRNFFALQPNSGLRFTSAASKLIRLNRLFAGYGNMDRPTRMLHALFRGFPQDPGRYFGPVGSGPSPDRADPNEF